VRTWIAIAALLLSTMTTTGAAAGYGTTPFDLLVDGSIVVPVTIGGTGPYRFVIDTGSSRTVISSRLSDAVGAPFLAKTLMVTPAGRDLATVVSLNRIAIAGRPAGAVAAAVMRHDRYAAGEQVDGLIGQDVLSRVAYTIDYRERTLTWRMPDEQPPGLRLPMVIEDNRPLVILPQRDGDTSPLRLIPDSGADGLVLFPHAENKLALTPIDVGVLSGIAGSRPATRVSVDRLVIGTTLLRDTLAAIVDSGEPAETMGDGLLPLHVFSRVTVNAREGYLILERD
jgi:predicted aspartyl protease